MKQQTEHNQSEQCPLTKETALQLVELLKNQKIQVKHGSLNAILQYTRQQESKQLFKDTDLFVQINKVLNNQKLTKICLSTLIHFSSTQFFQKEFVRFVQPLIFNLKQWKDDLREELSLLCLLNISKYQSVIEQLINKEQKRGFLLEVLYGFMEIKQARRWVVTNIFVNVSSIEVGRKYLCEQKIYLRFLEYINAEKESVRLGVLKILRNASFQWQVQEFISQVLKQEHNLINKLAQHILYVVYKGKICPNTSDEQLMKIIQQYQPLQEEAQKTIKRLVIASKEKGLAEISLIIDIIMILSNSNFAERKIVIKQNPLKQILSLLKFSDLPEGDKDKLQALEVYCFN